MELSPTARLLAGKAHAAAEVHESVIAALERLGTAAALVDPVGMPLYLGPLLRSLLEPDDEAGRVLAAAGALARRLSRRDPEDDEVYPCASTMVRTGGADYALRAVPHPMRGRAGGAFLVSVVREDGVLPSTVTLTDRHGLTPREAQVALLLARGASDREAGERLCISHHTVRKHAEHIFAKLGIHTRKALALRLMGP